MNSPSLSKNMSPHVVVLGAGCIGAYIARVLSQSNVQVTAVDVSSEALHRLQKGSPSMHVMEADLSDPRNIRPIAQNADLVVLDVRLKGKTHHAYFSLRDQYHTGESASAMARTTGLPCVAMVLALLTSPSRLPAGVYPPELIGQDELLFQSVVESLKTHGVKFEYGIMPR